MKPRPDRSNVKAFSADDFIEGAAAVDREPAGSTRSNTPAAGYVRRTFDLPRDLARRLKLEAAKSDRPMREIVEEALNDYFEYEAGR